MNRTYSIVTFIFAFMVLAGFSVEPAHAASRLLVMENAYNARDLGGYAASNGKTVRWGALYRAGDLHSLSDNDVDILRDIGIKTVVDFRTDGERQAEPHRLPPTVVNIVALPITPGNIPDLTTLTEKNAEEMMLQVYRALVTDARQQYREFFRILADPDNGPVLFNCSAGKDRTGLAAALVLLALGVDRETVYEDYLLSAEYVKDKYQRMVDENPALRPVVTVRREYLRAALDEIDAKYGGIGQYLREQLNVDTELLLKRYTE